MAIGETGLDYYRDCAPRSDQQRAFEAQIELARELGKPLVIHTRAAEEDTLGDADERAGGRQGDPALLLDARARRGVPGAPRLVDLVRRQRHLPRREHAARGRGARPAERLLVETDAPYLSPQPVRGKPNQPANVVHTATRWRSSGGSPTRSSSASIEANAAEVFGW